MRNYRVRVQVDTEDDSGDRITHVKTIRVVSESARRAENAAITTMYRTLSGPMSYAGILWTRSDGSVTA
jgi:hypothetical protein